MFSFSKIAPPALAALLLVALPAWSASADPAAAKPAVKESKESKETKDTKAAGASKDSTAQPKEQAKQETAKDAAADKSREAKPGPPPEVMVRVNGTAITKPELDRAVKVMLAQNQVPQPVAPELLKQVQSAALDQLTAAELLYQEAAKVEIKDLDKQIKDKVAQNKAKFPSEADFEKALKSVDMTAKDMEDFTRKDIVITNFIETAFAAKTKVTDEEVAKFYDDNVEKYFKKPETARASHILIGADEKASAEDKKKAKEKAEAILKRVKGGEDFAAVAKAESSCPSSAQGGDLGTFGRGQMVPPFDQAVFAMKPGEISGVVETQFGYHVIKLVEKKEATTEKLADVKGKISDFLKKEKIQKELLQFVDNLKKTAKIEVPEKPESAEKAEKSEKDKAEK